MNIRTISLHNTVQIRLLIEISPRSMIKYSFSQGCLSLGSPTTKERKRKTKMEVVMKSREDLGKEELYFLMVAESQKMQTQANHKILVKDWVLANDIDNETGEIKSILFVRSTDTTYSTISKTFIEAFKTIVQCFGSDGFNAINVKEGTSNKGRKFIYCEYAKADK